MKIFTFILLVVTTGTALGQPATPSWEVKYKGSIMVGAMLRWSAPDWASGGPQFTQYGSSPMSGNVKVRFRWLGGTQFPVPKILTLRVDASVNSGGSSATAFNGFETASGASGANASGKYILQKPGSSEIILSYDMRASVSSGGFFAASLQASPDPRYARISIAGVPITYVKKFKQRSSFIFPRTDTPGSVEYDEYEPDGIAYNTSDSRTVNEVDYGLPMGTILSNPTVQPPLYTSTNTSTSLTLLGSANTFQLAPEWYRFETSLITNAREETLPSGLFQNGWDIAPLNNVYQNPYVYQVLGLLIQPKPTFSDGDVGKIEGAKLRYRWADGAKAETVMFLKFHYQTDNPQNLGTPQRFTDWSLPPEEVPLQNGEASSGATQWPATFFSPSPLWKVGKGAASVATVVPNPYAVAAGIFAQIGLDLSEPQSVQYQWPRGARTEANTDWMGRPPYPNADINLFSWKAYTQKQSDIQYILRDVWNASGFAGQGFDSNEIVRSFIARSEDVRTYRFFYRGPL